VNLPGSNNGSEPSLAISNDGIRYASWQSPGEFANSADGFNFAQPATPIPDSGAAGDVTNAISYSGAPYNGDLRTPHRAAQLHLSQPQRGGDVDHAEQARRQSPWRFGPAVDRRLPEEQHDSDGV
jgi:hypothetical protein